MQKPVLHPRARNLDAIGEDEVTPKGARGDAAVQEDPGSVGFLRLPAADR